MKNLFIVNTPFHLLTSFILINTKFKEDENYLALIHPHSYEKWEHSPIMKYMSSKAGGFLDIFLLKDFMHTKKINEPLKMQIEKVQNTLGKLNIDNIFLGSDIDPQNQMLVATLGKNTFYRIEDGLFSYVNHTRKRSFLKIHFHRFKIKMQLRYLNIKSDLYINTETQSSSKAGIVDFMYKPHLIKRYAKKTIAITKKEIEAALKVLTTKNLYKAKFQRKALLYLSQPLAEQKKISLDDEIMQMEKIIEIFKGHDFIFKPHPNDSQKKIELIKNKFPHLIFFDEMLPLEILLYLERNISALLSYASTSLIYTDLFSKKAILPISISDLNHAPMNLAYKEVMEECNVLFPQTLEELKNIWENYENNTST